MNIVYLGIFRSSTCYENEINLGHILKIQKYHVYYKHRINKRNYFRKVNFLKNCKGCVILFYG